MLINRKDNYIMISLKVIGIGAVISYGIALLMKLTLVCIRGISGLKTPKEEQK